MLLILAALEVHTCRLFGAAETFYGVEKSVIAYWKKNNGTI